MKKSAIVCLSPRHEAFVQRIASGEPASRAYRAVYGSKGATAEVNASRLLRNAKVSARLDELRAENGDQWFMTRATLARHLIEVIYTPAGEITSESNLAEVFWERVHRNGSVERMVRLDKMGAAKLLVRICGWDKPAPPKPPSQSSAEVEAALDRLFRPKQRR